MTKATHDNSNDISAELRRDLSLVLPIVERLKSPEIQAYLKGRPASMEDAAASAGRLLDSAIAPAIVGLNGLTIEAVREAVALAERIKARLLPLPVGDPVAQRLRVMQSATLGHAYAGDLRVAFRDANRQGDGVANVIEDSIAARVPNTLFVDGGDLDALLKLRMQVCERGAETITSMTALPVKHVVVVLPADADTRVQSQWHELAAELQLSLRMSVVGLPGGAKPRAAGNIRGAIEVITWQTGLSYATGGVDFADGSPRPCADAVSLLHRGAVDVAVDAGIEPLELSLISGVKHRIRIGDALDGNADVCFVTPGLRVGLRARVMRFDGLILWLCDDPSPGVGAVVDPVVGLVGRLMESEMH